MDSLGLLTLTSAQRSPLSGAFTADGIYKLALLLQSCEPNPTLVEDSCSPCVALVKFESKLTLTRFPSEFTS